MLYLVLAISIVFILAILVARVLETMFPTTLARKDTPQAKSMGGKLALVALLAILVTGCSLLPVKGEGTFDFEVVKVSVTEGVTVKVKHTECVFEATTDKEAIVRRAKECVVDYYVGLNRSSIPLLAPSGIRLPESANDEALDLVYVVETLLAEEFMHQPPELEELIVEKQLE